MRCETWLLLARGQGFFVFFVQRRLLMMMSWLRRRLPSFSLGRAYPLAFLTCSSCDCSSDIIFELTDIIFCELAFGGALLADVVLVHHEGEDFYCRTHLRSIWLTLEVSHASKKCGRSLQGGVTKLVFSSPEAKLRGRSPWVEENFSSTMKSLFQK